MDDINQLKLGIELIKFIESKRIVRAELLQLLKSKDRQKIIEFMIENLVQDIQMYGSLQNDATKILNPDAHDDPPLTTKDVEELKKTLFDIM